MLVRVYFVKQAVALFGIRLSPTRGVRLHHGYTDARLCLDSNGRGQLATGDSQYAHIFATLAVNLKEARHYRRPCFPLLAMGTTCFALLSRESDPVVSFPNH